jgi:hypothetical protein
MTNRTAELDRLGAALERRVASELARGAGEPGSSARRRRPRRRLLLAAAALAVAIPGVAVGGQLISNDSVAQGLPAGSAILAQTDPTCSAVTPGVEYRCTLARPPAPEVTDFAGTVEPLVDATKHVNGGCRSLQSDGLLWECYIGQAAVDEEIIGHGLLGAYSPTPGVG